MTKPKIMKRALDIIGAAIGLIILSPLFLLIWILVKRRLGSPVLFRQTRPGLNGKPFQMLKFRTMSSAVGENGELLPDASRLTDFGKKLRSTSFDELPELWNVLIGDMSLVGPRPLLMQYLPLYSKKQARRHEVRPGITGWAQVNGRNSISWDDKFNLDVWYVDNATMRLDMKILILTVKKVFHQEGVNSSSDVTMPIFEKDDRNEL